MLIQTIPTRYEAVQVLDPATLDLSEDADWARACVVIEQPSGSVRAHVARGPIILKAGNWLVRDLATGALDVLVDADMRRGFERVDEGEEPASEPSPPSHPYPEPQPAADETDPEPAAPDFDAMTGPQLDAWADEHLDDRPDGWSSMRVAVKRETLAAIAAKQEA